MWDLSLPPGIELTSPVLESGFLITGPPEKSPQPLFRVKEYSISLQLWFSWP